MTSPFRLHPLRRTYKGACRAQGTRGGVCHFARQNRGSEFGAGAALRGAALSVERSFTSNTEGPQSRRLSNRCGAGSPFPAFGMDEAESGALDQVNAEHSHDGEFTGLLLCVE